MKHIVRALLLMAFALICADCGGGSDEEILSSVGSSSHTDTTDDEEETEDATPTYVATIYASDNATLATVLAGLIDGVDLDSEGNAQITQSAIDATTSLDLSQQGLTSLAGIEYFVNLTSLDFSNNSVSNVDLSALTSLTYLDCSENQLTSLDLDALTNLKKLYCNDNLLTSLDVSACTKLNYLDCSGNQLTSLDLTSNTALIKLTCGAQTTGIIVVTLPSTLESLVTESDVYVQISTSSTGTSNYEGNGKF